NISAKIWPAAAKGLKLPLRGLMDWWCAAKTVGVGSLPLARHLSRTIEDALRWAGIGTQRQSDLAVRGMLSALVEDTVHATLNDAPLINSALGISIRDAGVYRHRGGMRGFWKVFCQ